jgi:hypothetical protein
MLIYTHCWELMNSVGSRGSLSLPFVMKVMVCHFVSDSHEVMTALIVVLPIIVVVEIFLQLHQASFWRHVAFHLLRIERKSEAPAPMLLTSYVLSFYSADGVPCWFHLMFWYFL